MTDTVVLLAAARFGDGQMLVLLGPLEGTPKALPTLALWT